MLQSSGSFALVVAALLVVCSAEPRQDSEGSDADRSRYVGGHQTKDSDLSNSNSLSRNVRESQPYYGLLPYLMTRRHDYASPSSSSGSSKQVHWPSSRYSGYTGEGYLKRNFDEIDLSGLNNFVRKRNFDEIDQSWLPFPHKKRFFYNGAFADLSGFGFDKKRYKPDYPMDEIDLSSFPIGSKRSQHMITPQ